MKRFLLILSILIIVSAVNYAQVAEMKWELDYEVFMTLANDSNYTLDIKDAFHVTDSKQQFASEFIFYPVNPGMSYARELSGQEEKTESYKTLWSALHAKIGGGWVHFANCLAYAMETGRLNLQEPIMKRPDSDWKPNPVTESYKRTKNWQYYVPLNQKNALKEYKWREKNQQLGDIKNLPNEYLILFTNTSQKDYNKLIMEDDKKQLAKINLLKIIMGANYLGEAQITYISNAVLSAIKNYSASKLPSVIIFDDLDAAAAMTLSIEGYAIESVVFKASANLSDEDVNKRTKQIQDIVNNINSYNNKAFQNRLGNYYSN